MMPAVRIAQKFERFLETYRRPDGARWGGQDLHDATGGVVTRSYVSNLRKGRIENPGFEKLAAIAKAMGFPPELWFEEGAELDQRARVIELPDDRQSLSERLNCLFEAIKKERANPTPTLRLLA
jgi:transcriptional regulator with XRE-family HTH domain